MINITLPGDRIDDVAAVAAAGGDIPKIVSEAKHQVKHGVIAASAPGEIRTHTGRVLKGYAEPALTSTNVTGIPLGTVDAPPAGPARPTGTPRTRAPVVS